jgi:hypothetical protein
VKTKTPPGKGGVGAESPSGFPGAFGGRGGLLALQVTDLTTPLFDFVVLFAHSCFILRTMTSLVRTNMRIAHQPFNSFFLALVLGVAGSLAGAPAAAQDSKTSSSSSSSKKKKEEKAAAMVRVFMETTDDGTAPKVDVIRSRPISVAITKQPFIDERDIVRAILLETPDGGFMIKLEMTSHGKQALEMATVSSNGRRMVVFSQWTMDGVEKPEERWLAAPLIRSPLHDGVMVFSVDSNREEANRIVDGINNVAIKLKNQPKNKSSTATSAPKSEKNKPPSTSNSTARDLIDKNQKQ